MSTFNMFKIVSSSTKICWRCYSTNNRPSICLKRALLVSKLSRYEFERYRNPDLDEIQLECALRKRGSDYDMLLKHHHLHKEFESSVVRTLEASDIETKVVNRFDYDAASIDWCDVVIPTGGDGTYLLGASRVAGSNKPVIGLNSDPNRSEGHLCLPKKYSNNVKAVVDKLKKGEFEWKFRSRIRITLCGEKIFDPPVELHEQELLNPDFRFFDCVTEEQKRAESLKFSVTNTRVLPVLALNEVFIGECLSARVSYMEMRLDGGDVRTKVKSSGLCVCTGTGSTSWHLSINRLTEQSVTELLAVLGKKDPTLVKEVMDKFNNNLVFRSDDSRMGYTVRDLIAGGVWPNPKGLAPRGFASLLEVRSRCFNAGLVIDGGISYNFNDGTVAFLEINEKDALRTVTLRE